MKIKIKSAPEWARFEESVPYLVYVDHRRHRQGYVFDENGETFHLIDLEWEIFDAN